MIRGRLVLIAGKQNRAACASTPMQPQRYLHMQYTTHQPRSAGLEIFVRRKGSGDNMEPDLPTIIEQLDLRVFVRFDEDYGVYVARCIDTGAVATGHTIEETETLIQEILANDLRIAMEEGSLKSLFHAEAPWDSKVGWYETKAANPENVKTVRLEVAPGPQKRSVQSEFKLIGKTREGSSAA